VIARSHGRAKDDAQPTTWSALVPVRRAARRVAVDPLERVETVLVRIASKTA